MPNAFDPSIFGAALPLSHNPLQRLSYAPPKLVPNLDDIINAAILWVQDILFPAIKEFTGVDLAPFLPELKSVVANLEILFGGALNPTSGEFNPVAALQAFTNLFITLGVNLPITLIQELEGFTSGTSILSQLIGALTGGNVPGNEGLLGLANFFNFDSGTTDIVSLLGGAVMDWAAMGLSLFGITGLNQAGVSNAGANLMALLANPLLGINPASFNPIGAAEQMLQDVFTPAGALTSLTQIPSHLFGMLSPGSNVSRNMLPDPGFDSAASFSGLSVWTWDGTVGCTALGSAKTVADGTLHELLGVPIATTAGQSTSLTTYARWTGVTATTGAAMVLAANAYDANDNLISDPANRVVASVTTPGAASASYTGNVSGWVPLVGTAYIAPTGAAYVRMSLEVTAAVTAGSVWFDDCAQTVQGVIDASLLGNIEQMPQLFGQSIPGFQGLPDLPSTLGHIVDGLGTSFTAAGEQTGLAFSGLFELAQQIAQQAGSAMGLATTHAQVLGLQTTAPNMSGLDPTAEATFDLSDLPHGTTLPTTTIATGTSLAGFVNIKKDATKGFVEFLASMPSGSSGVYVNVYSVNTTTGLRTLLWGSSDISATIPTTMNWVKALIPGGSQPAVHAADQIQLSVVNQSSVTVTICAKTFPNPPRTSGIIRNFGATRTTGGSISPTTLANTAFTYGAICPWLSFGVQNVPPNYQPDVKFQFTTGGTGAIANANQDTDWTLPTWFRPGIDYLDYVLLSGGGGGDSGTGGTGAPAGATSITVDSVVHSVAGGAAGNSGGALTTGDNQGKGAGQHSYLSETYYGGGNVGPQATGSQPGGGGGGGAQFVGYTTYYGQGGHCGLWADGTLQPTTMTIHISNGHGGRGQSNYGAGWGVDGSVWLKARQNPSA